MDLTIHDVFRTVSGRVARLTRLDDGSQDLYVPAELSAIWRRQLDAPLDVDLASQLRDAGTTFTAASSTADRPPHTFRELLQHPAPPLALLKLAKDFAKLHARSRTGVLPRDIALTLYHACIAAALTRCNQRITTLDDQQLRHGLNWALAHPWLDEPTRARLQDDLRRLPA